MISTAAPPRGSGEGGADGSGGSGSGSQLSWTLDRRRARAGLGGEVDVAVGHVVARVRGDAARQAAEPRFERSVGGTLLGCDPGRGPG
ncbi:MAG: hypothetical protein V9E94_18565 [Microthrixaceae bacterium]